MVGGAVRDRLVGRAVADVDFAAPLTPEAVMARATDGGVEGGADRVGAWHGDVGVAWPGV